MSEEVATILEKRKPEICEKDTNLTTKDLTNVQKFYSGTNIFITGGTGFLGKILLEKLLRSCPNINRIFLLVRNKRGKSVESRGEELLEDAVFKRLHTECPKSIYKIVFVSGDCSLPGLGIKPENRLILQQHVNIVFHAAATVRFDEKLRLATAINIIGTREVLDLCREMPGLKAIVHVSTAFANCPWKFIDEKFYDPPISPDKLIELTNSSDDEQLEKMLPKILGKWPNTYSFTKAIGEDLVRHESKGLSTAVFRPSIVVSSYREPIPGWVDNLYGFTGVCAGAVLGFLRTLHCDANCIANVIPVDMCVNSLICAAKETGEKKSDSISIYNYVSSKNNSMKWGKFMEMCEVNGVLYPSIRAVWYYSLTLNKVWAIHWLYVLVLHLLPALLVDTVLLCTGQKPKMLHAYKNIIKFNRLISYFCLNTWIFKYDNVISMWDRLEQRDCDLFFFDMRIINWTEFFKEHMPGVRLYLLKDHPDTLPQAWRRWRLFYCMHQLGKVTMWFLFLRILWYFISFVLY